MPCPLALLVLWCGLAGTSSPARQTHDVKETAHTNPALEQFKSLAGDWDGKDSRGGVIHASYQVLASGVVMERLQPEGQPGMMTMYSLDGDHILAIHFCSAGNQPILRTGPLSSATGKYDFQLERAYGLASADELHMIELLMVFPDSDHLSQSWTNLDHGKRSTNTLTFVRKK